MIAKEKDETEREESEELFFSAVRLAMKSAKELCGLDPKEKRITLKRLGYELGHSASRYLKATTMEELIDELSLIWSSYSLGQLELFSLKPLILDIYDCYDCLGNRYGVGVTLCPFKEGFLKAILEDKLGLKNEIVEIECCGTFQTHCKFEIKTKEFEGGNKF
ncbi:MAG: hypothetical protein QXX95_00580 [Nitrososphaerales archaeon]